MMNSRRWLKSMSVALGMALAASIAASPALAYTPTYFRVKTLLSGGCAPGTPLVVTGGYAIGLGDYGGLTGTLTNLRTGESRSTTWFEGLDGPVGPTSRTGTIAYTPAGTKAGDHLKLKVQMHSYLGYGSVHSIELKCGSLAIVSNVYDDTGSDYRINGTDAEPGPVAMYCKSNNDLDVYAIDATSGASQFAMRVPKSQIDSVPAGAVNQLIAQAGAITLWRLTSGEIQLNSPFGDEGKVYVFIFNGCPYDGSGYTLIIDPHQ